MPEYLTSSEALLTLPQAMPAHRVRGGLKGLGVGVVSTAGGVAGGPTGFYYTLQNFEGWKAVPLYIGSVLLAIVGTPYGMHKLADGTTSFFDPILQHRRDGFVYHRNEGYVSDHSRFDRRFGTVIRPIDTPAKLEEIKDGKWMFKSPEFFINGATLKNARFRKEITEERVRDGRKVTITRIVRVQPQEILDSPLPVGYTALATVEFDGKEFSARTGNGWVVKYLAGKEAGSALRLRGRYERQHDKDRFDMKEIDEALLRDAT